MAEYKEKKEEEIIQHLRQWIQSQNIFKNRHEIAQYLHISKSHLNNIVNGRRKTTSDILNKIVIMTEFKNEKNSSLFYPSEKRPYLAFAEELRSWFTKQKRWETQKEIAEYLGIPYSSFKKYFQGRSIPKGEIRDKLFQITDIELLKVNKIKKSSKEIQSQSQDNTKDISFTDHIDEIDKSVEIIQKELESLRNYIKENKKSFKDQTKSTSAPERLTAAFYSLSEEIISFRKSNLNQREKVRQMISSKDVGYIISFLKALFDEDKFSDFIFFSTYEFENKGEKK